MTKKYIYCQDGTIEEFLEASKNFMLSKKDQFRIEQSNLKEQNKLNPDPDYNYDGSLDASCVIKPNYKDRVTGVIADTMVLESKDGEIMIDRAKDPIYHPTDQNKSICSFNEDNNTNELRFAYTTTQTWRDNNSVGQSYTIINETEAEAEGFILSDND